MINEANVRDLLVKVYGNATGDSTLQKLVPLLQKHEARVQATHRRGVNQRDTILITYPDQVQQAGQPTLAVLAEFCQRYLLDAVTGIHILPFYPWTSDDGFSVMDYREVDTSYGNWSHVKQIGEHFRLMLDAVINHLSVSSYWFQSMLRGDPNYQDHFVIPDELDDLSRVVRPRALPLLTIFQTALGEKRVWTTFSADQVDLNYSNPDVLLEILDILLFYASQGADFIRLDAIAYLWKESGTSCINLPQTHHIIQLIRAVLDEAAPHVMLITETNIPHADNISYFGDGTNEAQMVYNFSLPPLVLHAFQTGSAETLSQWADILELPSTKVTFFNFLASHDGIGLNPLRGILPESEIEKVVQRVQEHGGLVSYKTDVGGVPRPYELNINYFDALNHPNVKETVDIQIDRFITAHAILMAMQGVPGIYFHSLFGSRGWPEGASASGQNRTINRRKLQKAELLQELSDPRSLRARIFFRLSHLLRIRRRYSAFHPHGSQKVVHVAPQVFCLLRSSPNGNDHVLCLHNISSQRVLLDKIQIPDGLFPELRNIISGQSIEEKNAIVLEPYQTLWLAAGKRIE